MQKLSEMPKGEAVTLLVYGSTGTGKTELVGTAGSRTVIINIGLGTVTLQSKGFKIRNPNIDPFIETIQEEILPDKATAFDQTCELLDSILDPKNPIFNEYDTIAIDDATALRRFAMSKGLEINGREGKSNSLIKSKASGVIQKAIQDYGIEMDFIEQFIIHYVSECKRLNKHLILTAHERVEYNKPTTIGGVSTINKIRPGFTGQTFPDNVTGHFDLIWHLETMGAGDRVIHQARTVGDSSLTAKTRWDGMFPVMLSNPNFLKIVEVIRNG